MYLLEAILLPNVTVNHMPVASSAATNVVAQASARASVNVESLFMNMKSIATKGGCSPRFDQWTR